MGQSSGATVQFKDEGTGGCSWLGATLHLRQEDGGCDKDEKSLESISSRFQPALKGGKCVLGYKQDSKNDQTRQSDHPRQKPPSLKEI